MAIKPWYKIITPREDLREGKPLDASEFAVHLDHVRDGRAPSVYQKPVEFFERTFLTKNLRELSVQTVRRLNGVKVETSAVFNLATQFGGGKTHALTLLYHLAHGGDESKGWKGVDSILRDAGVTSVPKAATAIFVGTEFDSFVGRGGDDGTPNRRTPWGEIAFQLGGADGFKLVAEHDKELTAPGGDVIERMLPAARPTLILLDELMNYVSRTRKSGLASQLYNFLHNLSEVSRSHDNVVLAVSIPASELEMTAEDQSDFERYKKLLDRLGKAIIMSAEAETSEIIRRRLFEWNGLPNEALKTIEEYEVWFQANKHQLPSWFPVETARDTLKASYPFHPSLLSVFERKWQGLPRFQQTRGVLRLLALWVSKAYSEGYKGSHKDPLISLGTAPLEDPLFRAAVFEQIGESRLEAAVTTDIAGKDHAHALRVDAEATAEVKKARLHRKVATVVFFESNGGQQRGEATLPEVRLAPPSPSRYRLRREPRPECLSTLEAIVQALALLEPEVRGLGELLAAFDGMIDAQLAYVAARASPPRRRQGRGRGALGLPRALVEGWDRLVVAYAETWRPDPGGPRRIAQLTAVAAGTGATFERLARTPESGSPGVRHLAHMGLLAADFETAVGADDLRAAFGGFLEGQGGGEPAVVAAWSQATLDVLGVRGACLKSAYRHAVGGKGSLDEVVLRDGIEAAPGPFRGRAAVRTARALAAARWLHRRSGAA